MLAPALISALAAAAPPARQLEFASRQLEFASPPDKHLCPNPECSQGCGEAVQGVPIPSGYCAACFSDDSEQCALHGPGDSTGLFIDVPDFFITGSQCCNVLSCVVSTWSCDGSEPAPPPVKPFVPFERANEAAVAKGKRAVLAFAVSGGGDRAFTEAMAVARAGAIAGVWPQLTHMISNSGGSWFNSNFLFSQEFFGWLTGPTLPIADVIRTFKAQSDTAVVAAEAAGKLTYATDITLAPQPGSDAISDAVCKAYNALYWRILDAILFITRSNETLPFGDWQQYITAAYLEGGGQPLHPTPPNIPATQIIQSTVPPDTYVSRTGLRTLVVQTQDSTTASWLEPDGTTLKSMQWPISHVIAGPHSPPSLPASEWNFGSTVTDFDVRDESNSQTQPLPTVAVNQTTIATASSAAPGLISSPRMLNAYLINTGNSAAAESFPLCIPGEGGSERIAVGTPNWAEPEYRLLDGGATDNSGIALALSRIGRECEAPDSKLDCTDGVYIVFVDADRPRVNISSADELSMRYLFSVPRSGVTPAPPGGRTDIYDQGTLAPNRQVFADPFPPEDEWRPWLNASLPAEQYPIYEGGQTWQGVVHTIDNPWFGVKAGMRVNLRIIRPVRDRDTFFNGNVYYNRFAYDAVHIARDSRPLLEAFLYGAK